jgi:hypothetical protein
MKNGKLINHHVYSSIWSSVKHEVHVIKENSCWKVGNGQSINLWTDSWCGEPLASSQNIHPNVLIWLPNKVSDLIQNQAWLIPQCIDRLFPQIKSLVQQVTLPIDVVSKVSMFVISYPHGLVRYQLCSTINYDFK